MRAGIGFSQESTRYCTYNNTMEFIIPSWSNIQECEFEIFNIGDKITSVDVHLWSHADLIWAQSMINSAISYTELLVLGWKAQQARSVLPNSLKTEIWSTCNLREMRHIFQLRTAIAAHPDFRALSIPMLAEMKQLIPIVFDDIG